MCGIVGYIGRRQAAPILLHGLKKLEYRGYDSAGIAVRDGIDPIQIIKTQGRIAQLAAKIGDIQANCGIGHTRWATHGAPSESNAHPHQSADGAVTLVHNGILENHAELRKELACAFRSQTDSEVIAAYLAHELAQGQTPLAALQAFLSRARGSFALAVMFKEYPNELYAVRKESPLVVGVAKGEALLASDVSPLLEHTRRIYYMENGELARLTAETVAFYAIDGTLLEKRPTEIGWQAEAVDKGSYPHFMLKEIYEQPQAVCNTLQAANTIRIGEIQKLHIVACGSAYHAGVVGGAVIEKITGLSVRVELASEFRYRAPRLTGNTLVIVVSQSGETADSLAALREAQRRGAQTLAVVNVVGSSIAREADAVFYTQAGPEIAVATTKAYSAQLVACYLLALELGKARKTLTKERYEELFQALQALPKRMERTLQNGQALRTLAERLQYARSLFFIGRGLDYAVSMEGSLKMKEISYIHSEAYAAGELKHGTLSLIEEDVWTVCVLTQSHLTEKTVSNMAEVKSRGGKLLAITTEASMVEGVADEVIVIPKTEELFAASLAVLPLQLLSYYVSVARGLDVDKPRNLAKSVTVE